MTRSVLDCRCEIVRSWAPKVLMCQAKGGLGGYLIIQSCRSIHSFHYMTRERLDIFSYFLHSFRSFPSRESGYRCSILCRDKGFGTSRIMVPSSVQEFAVVAQSKRVVSFGDELDSRDITRTIQYIEYFYTDV